MKVLIIGGGGREHALAWKISQSPRVTQVLCRPGNGGTTGNVPGGLDAEELAAFAEKEGVDLTVVGPEAPLTEGIVDLFESRGLRIFGPGREGARLEESKAFTKEILLEAGVDTAAHGTFVDAAAAHAYIKERGAPIVVKADGLAAGKGVTVCATTDEAHQAVDEAMVDNAFGDAGARVVIEEMLLGEEASFIALVDGKNVLPLASSQDHKRIGEGDTGPNTGGMGAYSPAPIVTEEIFEKATREVCEPVVAALRARGIIFKGVLYAGLMIHEGRIRVLEFNVRFGDPECQPLMMRLRTDLIDLIDAVIDGHLDQISIEWDPRPAACVVIAAAGYPGTPTKGDTIHGLEQAAEVEDSFVFHAGTKDGPDGTVETAGGRVLGVTALGDSIGEAVARAYEACDKISWPGLQFRRDIGHRAL
ncbi:MAG: phosphoribosylamine--glycine ligase [Candidatus Binatia bacterium]|nr:phosphoribosylamine--glycine ligase [Candidatus Binatia bacterium]MDG2010028.1 phosphoribosylamine--glycine ligase [Candidatus Binatia bacterium]HAC81937.1 phosphoribosylamine--glycine ligase [Deltaproteobacteria bacterium]